MERVEECDCPLVVVPGPVMVVTHRHRHACAALEKRFDDYEPEL